MKHTPGPLTVAISDKWPFDILTKNADGEIVFTTRMPCHSTADKSKEDAISCKNFDSKDREEYSAANRRAIADEVLRAAAHDLLELLQEVRVLVPESYDLGDRIDAAISKATGDAS